MGKSVIPVPYEARAPKTKWDYVKFFFHKFMRNNWVYVILGGVGLVILLAIAVVSSNPSNEAAEIKFTQYLKEQSIEPLADPICYLDDSVYSCSLFYVNSENEVYLKEYECHWYPVITLSCHEEEEIKAQD